MTSFDASIAAAFISSAEKAAEENRAETARKAQKARDDLKEHLGPVVEDFERELEPLLLGIAALPKKDGARWSCPPLEESSWRNLKTSVKLTRELPDGKEETHSFTLQVLALSETKTDFGVGYQDADGVSSGSRREDKQPADWQGVREKLAGWFARVAPDRIDELKALLLPDEHPSMALNNDVRVDSPLRLKSSNP